MSEAGTYAEGQWAWGTKNVAWKDERNGDRILVVWRRDAWHGVEVGNVWAESQITDVRLVDRPADAVRRVTPDRDRETIARALFARSLDRLGPGYPTEAITWEVTDQESWRQDADAVLAVLVPADPPWANADTFHVHVTFDRDALNLIRAEALEEWAATVRAEAEADERGLTQILDGELPQSSRIMLNGVTRAAERAVKRAAEYRKASA